MKTKHSFIFLILSFLSLIAVGMLATSDDMKVKAIVVVPLILFAVFLVKQAKITYGYLLTKL